MKSRDVTKSILASAVPTVNEIILSREQRRILSRLSTLVAPMLAVIDSYIASAKHQGGLLVFTKTIVGAHSCRLRGLRMKLEGLFEPKLILDPETVSQGEYVHRSR